MDEVEESPPVVIDFANLREFQTDLSSEINEAFGPSGLGIIAIKNVPKFPEFRRRLLPLAARFAQLDHNVQQKYEDIESTYNVGWSCGKEVLQDGTPDTCKGSYYANPLCDTPTNDPTLLAQYPSYTRPNIWPRDELPDLEHAFKDLGKLIFDVGLMLAKHCDKHIASSVLSQGKHHHNPSQSIDSLHDAIAESPCPKGRLLCYLPEKKNEINHRNNSNNTNDSQTTAWCGWHLDHGSLTGLTPAYYIYGDKYENEVECPDPQAGLHIRNRKGGVSIVKINKDCIAYQVGEAMQVLSGGLLHATPHCVVAPRREMHAGALTRCTFALFMQPTWDHVMRSCYGDDVGVVNWKPGITFGEFSKRKFENYYK